MSRSGYIKSTQFSYDAWAWGQLVSLAIEAQQGQKLLRELVVALEAMPERHLIAHDLRSPEGVCALGCLGAHRGMELEGLDPEDADSIAEAFGVRMPLVRELENVNDADSDTLETRWTRVHAWALDKINAAP